MTTKLKNKRHAVLTRNGIANGRSAFAGPRSRAKLAKLPGLSTVYQQPLELTLRQIKELEAEIKRVELGIIRLGKQLPGLKQLLQVRGLGLLTAIGLLVEIGDINWFDNSKQQSHTLDGLRQRGNQARQVGEAGSPSKVVNASEGS